MFPETESCVIESVLSHSKGNVEQAAAKMLEMASTTSETSSWGGGDASPPPTPVGGGVGAQIDLDAELAHAMFRQFSEEIGQHSPPDVRSDPSRASH